MTDKTTQPDREVDMTNTKYKAGDKVTVVLDKSDANLLNSNERG